ncbi:hypothetical protein [Bacillus thuringiensis]|uniref:hypothetical protein n=1 Tax=Bacillus thuringiensis TaxID=1428 RepID=UPI0039879AB4
MRQSNEFCHSCLKSIEKKFLINESAQEHCCAECKEKQLEILKKIKKDTTYNISKNKSINETLDLLYKNEEKLLESVKMQSALTKGSIPLRKYMFSLLEEIHRFVYEASFECSIYCDLFLIEDKKFFSDRFFLRNAISKIIGSWEKVLRFHSLYFGITFDAKKKRNTLTNLQKKLNKTAYKQTDTYQLLYALKSKGLFKEIDENRKMLDHELTYQIGTSPINSAKKVLILTEHCTALYKCLEECITLYEKECRISSYEFIEKLQFRLPEPEYKVYKKKSQKLKKRDTPKDIMLFQEKSVIYLLAFQKRIEEVRRWKTKYSAPPMELLYYRLFDSVVRMHESARSLAYMLDMYAKASTLNYIDQDKYWENFQGMNYRYFLMSALLRIYSVYDKLAIVMQELFEVEPKRKTFEGTVEYIRLEESFYSSLPPMKLCNKILSTPSFKLLYKYRQDHFHLLTSQHFLPLEYKDISDFETCNIIIDNSTMIYELIDCLDQVLIRFHEFGNRANKIT